MNGMLPGANLPPDTDKLIPTPEFVSADLLKGRKHLLADTVDLSLSYPISARRTAGDSFRARAIH